MTGDHHGRKAGRATLLVTAMDDILGTHNAGDHMAAHRVGQFLANRLEMRELRGRAAAGDQSADIYLTAMLIAQRRFGELREWVDYEGGRHGYLLIINLLDRGCKPEIEAEVFAGRTIPVSRLIDLWHPGDHDTGEFNQRLRYRGLYPEGSIADRLR
jgi:hypothetical protein